MPPNLDYLNEYPVTKVDLTTDTKITFGNGAVVTLHNLCFAIPLQDLNLLATFKESADTTTMRFGRPVRDGSGGYTIMDQTDVNVVSDMYSISDPNFADDGEHYPEVVIPVEPDPVAEQWMNDRTQDGPA
jgi:hypothetical protein